MSAPEPASLNTNLVNLVLALLTPMFLWATEGDIRLAHIAAAQTLKEFGLTHRLSLFTAAKIIAFDIATLSSLSQSMYEDVSMLLGLRLRGNAISLDRSAARNRVVLDKERRSAAPARAEDSVDPAIAEAQRMVAEAKARVQAAAAPPAEAQPVAEPAAVAAPPPVSPSAAAPSAASSARTPAQQHQSVRAQAMTQVAEALTAELKDLPPEERWKEMARIEALTIAAADIASGAAPPSLLGDGRALAGS
jgi:hypothetical protein